MKLILIILSLFLCTILHAQSKYYIDSIAGSDSNPGTFASPWKTVAKVNSYFSSMAAGDSILFKRGQTFPGGIVVNKSGSSGSPIVISAYGIGEKPIITGFTTVAGWSLVSGSKYQATLNSALRLNMLTVDGVVIAPGRWPNPGALNRGYATAQSGTVSYPTSGTVVSTDITGSPSLTGSEMCSQPTAYTFNSRETVTSVSGTTVNFIPKSNDAMSNGWGFFFQYSDAFLDQTNEWYYNSASNNLRIIGNPAGKDIKAATVDYLVSLTNKSYITIDGIQLLGSDSSAILFTGTVNNITIRNCVFNWQGGQAIGEPQFGNTISNILIENNSIDNSNNAAINLQQGCSNITVRNNSIYRSGVVPGAHLWASNGMFAVAVHGPNLTISGNTIDSAGSVAIGVAGGDDILVENNYVRAFCSQVADAGGIYTNGLSGLRRIIRGNTVTDGIGNTAGSPYTGFRGANGIYLDEGASGVSVINNTVGKGPSYGVYAHQSSNNIIRGNTCYPGTSTEFLSGGITSRDDYLTATNVHNSNNRITQNILFLETLNDAAGISIYNLNPDSLATHFLDSNVYIRPTGKYGMIWVHSENDGKNDYYSSAGAYNKYGWELHGVEGPAFDAIKPLTYGSNLFANSSFNSGTSGATADAAKNTVSTETKLDGASLKATTAQSAGTELDVLLHFGAQISGKTFEVTFSAIGGATEAQNLKCYWIRNNSYGGKIAATTYIPLKTTRTENKIYATLTDNASDLILVLENRAANYPYWIDNVVCREVLTSTAVNVSDSILVDYNATNASKTINLNAVYLDPKYLRYNGSILLLPYSSAVLRRIEELPTGAPLKLKGKITVNQ